MTTRTGATLGNFDVLERIEPLRRERHTYCVTDHVDNPSLRAAMSFFDDSLVAPMQPCLLFLSCCARPAPLAVITSSAGDGKSALVGELVSAFEHPPVRSDVVVPTVLHLAGRGVLDTGLAARAVGSFVGTALGSVVGSAWILAGQLRENVRSLEQASQERMQKDPTGTVAGPFHGVGEDGPPSLRITSRELVVDEPAITEPALPPRRPPELPPT